MKRGTHRDKNKDTRRWDWQWWNANWTNPQAVLRALPVIATPPPRTNVSTPPLKPI